MIKTPTPPTVEPQRLCLPQYTVSLLNLLLRTSLGSDARICFRVLLPGGISGKLPKWFSQKRISAAVGDAAGCRTTAVVPSAVYGIAAEPAAVHQLRQR